MNFGVIMSSLRCFCLIFHLFLQELFSIDGSFLIFAAFIAHIVTKLGETFNDRRQLSTMVLFVVAFSNNCYCAVEQCNFKQGSRAGCWCLNATGGRCIDNHGGSNFVFFDYFGDATVGIDNSVFLPGCQSVGNGYDVLGTRASGFPDVCGSIATGFCQPGKSERCCLLADCDACEQGYSSCSTMLTNSSATISISTTMSETTVVKTMALTSTVKNDSLISQTTLVNDVNPTSSTILEKPTTTTEKETLHQSSDNTMLYFGLIGLGSLLFLVGIFILLWLLLKRQRKNGNSIPMITVSQSVANVIDTSQNNNVAKYTDGPPPNEASTYSEMPTAPMTIYGDAKF